MHLSKTGNHWFFGMKAYIEANADPGLVRAVRGTAGNLEGLVEANTSCTDRSSTRPPMQAIKAQPNALTLGRA